MGAAVEWPMYVATSSPRMTIILSTRLCGMDADEPVNTGERDPPPAESRP